MQAAHPCSISVMSQGQQAQALGAGFGAVMLWPLPPTEQWILVAVPM